MKNQTIMSLVQKINLVILKVENLDGVSQYPILMLKNSLRVGRHD